MRRLMQDRRGASAIEYAVIASAISVAAMAAMLSLGNQSNSTWTGIKTEAAKANSGS